MNDQQLEKKVRQDAGKVKKDLGILMKDSMARLGKFENSVSLANGTAQKDLTTWVEELVSLLSKDFEKLTGDARKTVVSTAATMKKDIGHGLSQYNAKAQEVAEKVPDGFAKKASRYPWVAISIGLVVGVVVGVLFKPARQPIEPVQI